MNYRIACICESEVCQSIGCILKNEPCEMIAYFHDVADFLADCRSAVPDIVLLDVSQIADNEEALLRLRENDPSPYYIGIVRPQDTEAICAAFGAKMDQVVFLPLESDALQRVVAEMTEKIAAKRKQEAKLEDLKEDDLPIFQDAFVLERILGSRELSDEKIQRRMECLQLHLEGPYYCVVQFSPYLMEKAPEEIDPLLMKMVSQVGSEFQRNGIACHTVSDSYCNVIAVLSFPDEQAYKKTDAIASMLGNKLMQQYDFDMFVGIGSMVSRFADINKSGASASEALAYKFTFSQNHVIHVRDVERYYNHSASKYRLYYDRVLGCFHDGNLQLMAVRLHELAKVVRTVSDNEVESMKSLCVELTAAVLRRTYEIGVERTDEMEGIYSYIMEMHSVDELMQWFINMCSSMLQKIAELRQNKNRQIVKIAQDYIHENIGNKELSLQMVSEEVDLSPAYFSGIFYKETDLHLNEYINQYRVQCAKEMLNRTNVKIVTISDKIGFSSPNYFNKVFKRYAGMTPKQYREQLPET